MGFSTGYSGPGSNAGWNGFTGAQSNQWGMTDRGTQSQPGDPMAAYRQAAGQYYGNTPGSAYYNGGAGGGGGGGNGYGSQNVNGSAINGLLAGANAANQASFNQANQANIANNQTGLNMLTSAQQQYNNNPLVGQARGLVGGLMADPLSLNQRTQNQIMNRATGSIDAGANQQLRNTAGSLAAGGQMDASSIAAAQNMIGRNSQAAQAGTQSNLGIQAALQRTQDIQNAARLGQQQNAQDFGVNQSTANSYLQNMYVQKPYMQDPSGQIAALGAQGGGGGGGGFGGGFGGGGGGMQGPYLQHMGNRGGLPANAGYGNGGGTTSFGATPDMTYNTGYNSQSDNANGAYY